MIGHESLGIDCLEKVVEVLDHEVKMKKEWGHWGNSLGISSSRKLLIEAAEILMAIAYNM